MCRPNPLIETHEETSLRIRAAFDEFQVGWDPHGEWRLEVLSDVLSYDLWVHIVVPDGRLPPIRIPNSLYVGRELLDVLTTEYEAWQERRLRFI